jgi:hypothetical protein
LEQGLDISLLHQVLQIKMVLEETLVLLDHWCLLVVEGVE